MASGEGSIRQSQSSIFSISPQSPSSLSCLDLSLQLPPISFRLSVLSICFLYNLRAFLTTRDHSCYGDNDHTITINKIKSTSLASEQMANSTNTVSSFRFCLVQFTPVMHGFIYQVTAVCVVTKA